MSIQRASLPISLVALTVASWGCGRTSSTPDDDPSTPGGAPGAAAMSDDEPQPPPDDETEVDPIVPREKILCVRDPIDYANPNGKCDHDINDPLLTLDDGFEFVDWSGRALARRGEEFRLFDVVFCETEELPLPPAVAGREIILSESFGPAAFLACDETSCDGYLEVPPYQEALGGDCLFGGFVHAARFPAGDLTHFTSDTSAPGSDLQHVRSCAWNAVELHCEFDGVAVGLAPDIPITNLTLEADRPWCVLLDFPTENTREVCWDGMGGISESPQGPAPGAIAAGGCETVAPEDLFVNYSSWALTTAGEVLRTIGTTGDCQTISEPLGAPVDTGVLGCACTMNPLVLTETELFASLDCINCK